VKVFVKYYLFQVLFVFVVCITNCNAQKYLHSTYLVDTLPEVMGFEKMTINEIRLDSILDESNRNRLIRINEGNAVIKGISSIDSQKSVNNIRESILNYDENRSRYKLDLLINGTINNEFLDGIDTLTSVCECYLRDDTIEIQMGLMAFGGFIISIKLDETGFVGSYVEDNYKDAIYKNSPADSLLSTRILIGNQEQLLLLSEEPRFSRGQVISGYLSFKTSEFFRSDQFKIGSGIDPNVPYKLDALVMKGLVRFKCEVRNDVDWK
jgi:hypothetical protein